MIGASLLSLVLKSQPIGPMLFVFYTMNQFLPFTLRPTSVQESSLVRYIACTAVYRYLAPDIGTHYCVQSLPKTR